MKTGSELISEERSRQISEDERLIFRAPLGTMAHVESQKGGDEPCKASVTAGENTGECPIAPNTGLKPAPSNPAAVESHPPGERETQTPLTAERDALRAKVEKLKAATLTKQ